MHVDLEAKELFKSKNLSEYLSNINTATIVPQAHSSSRTFLTPSSQQQPNLSYPKLTATAEPFLPQAHSSSRTFLTPSSQQQQPNLSYPKLTAAAEPFLPQAHSSSRTFLTPSSQQQPNLSYPKLTAAAEPFLHSFPTCYMAEAGIGHVNTILTRQRSGINLQNRADLPPKLRNVHPNNSNPTAAHQTHPSH